MNTSKNIKSKFGHFLFFSLIVQLLWSCEEREPLKTERPKENAQDSISGKFNDSYFKDRELYLAKWEKYSEKEKKENAREHKMFLRNDAYWYPRLQGGSGSIKEYNYRLSKTISANPNILNSTSYSPCIYWKPIGVKTTTYNGFTGVGRVNKVSFHNDYNAEYPKGTTPPNWDINANTFFASSPTGGLWKTEDGGGNWKNLGTDFLPFLGVTDFEVSDKNSDEMYIISSTKTDKSFAHEGKKGSLAIFRTVDGGKKWNSSGAPFTSDWTTYNTNNQYLNDLEVVENLHNGLPDYILAASELGIHRSTDRAQTWQRRQIGFGKNCSLGDATLEIDNMDKTRAYVSTQIEWKDGANNWDADSIYYSTTSGQFWKNWKTIDKHSCDPSKLSLGIPSNVSAFISGNKVLVSKTNSAVIYVIVHCYFRQAYTSSTTSCIPSVPKSKTLTYMFKSTNRGGTWTRKMCATTDVAGISHIGKYYINPLDDNQIHLMRNRGHSINNMAHWDDQIKNFIRDTPPPHMHADLQFLEFKTIKKCGVDKLYALTGTDGGVNLCEVKKPNLSYILGINNNDWSNVTGNGLQIGQIYNHSSSTNPKYLTYGSLDNGSWVRTGFGLNDWKVSLLGDGMDCVYDYADENTFYNSDNQSSGRLTKNSPITPQNPTDIKPSTGGGLQWLAPIEIDPVNHTSILAGYHNAIYKSNSTPITSSTWSFIPVTPMQTHNRKITQIAIDPTNSNIMFASSDWHFTHTHNGILTKGARLLKSVDEGANWVPSGEKWYRFITAIAITPNGQDMYVSMSGISWNGSPKNIMRSTDQGVTWENWNDNLPDVPVNCVIVNQFTNEVFCGTDYGVYRRKKTDTEWTKVGCGLPNVIVTDLSIVKGPTKEKLLRASTFGRGMWELEIVPGLILK